MLPGTCETPPRLKLYSVFPEFKEISMNVEKIRKQQQQLRRMGVLWERGKEGDEKSQKEADQMWNEFCDNSTLLSFWILMTANMLDIEIADQIERFRS